MKKAVQHLFFGSIFFFAFAATLFGQSGRVIAVLPFNNLSSAEYAWVSRGIEEILYDKFNEVSGVSVFERETLFRNLRELSINSDADVDSRKAFSLGKKTGVETVVLGHYRVNGQTLTVQFKLVSTYTGGVIMNRTFSGNISDMFKILKNAVEQAFGVMDISVSPEDEKALQEQPTHSIRAFEYYCKAYVEMGKGSTLEVIAGYFQRALQKDPNFWEAQYNIGVIYYNFDLYEKALRQFDSVIQSRPQFYKPYYGKGIIHYLKHHYREALADFRQVLAIHPDHDRSYYYLGMVLTRMDSIPQALREFRKSIAINPNYAPTYYQMARADMRRRWYRRAIKNLNQAIKLNPDYAAAHNSLGESYYAVNLFQQAIIEFRRVIQLRPHFATAYFNLGNAIYKKGALEEIVESYWALLEPEYLASNSPDPKALTTDLHELRKRSQAIDPGKIQRQMVNAYRLALKNDRKFYEASYNLALTYESMGKIDSAKIYYRKAISLQSNLSQAHMRLGKIYEKEKNYDLALKEFREVVKIDPSYFAADPRLGEPYRYLNIVEDVLQEYQKRLNLNARDKEALKVVGKIYLSMGRLGQAEEYYQELVQLNPADSSAKETLSQIRRKLRKL